MPPKSSSKYDANKTRLRNAIKHKVELYHEIYGKEENFEKFFNQVCKKQGVDVKLSKNIYESLIVVLSNLAEIECLTPYKDFLEPAQYFMEMNFEKFKPYLEGMIIEPLDNPGTKRAKRYKFTIDGVTFTQKKDGVFEGIYKDEDGIDVRAQKQAMLQKIKDEEENVKILEGIKESMDSGALPIPLPFKNEFPQIEKVKKSKSVQASVQAALPSPPSATATTAVQSLFEQFNDEESYSNSEDLFGQHFIF